MKKELKENLPASIAQVGYLLFCVITLLAYMIELAYVAVTIWEKASEIMQDIYGQIVAISTIVTAVTATIALLMMNFFFAAAER